MNTTTNQGKVSGDNFKDVLNAILGELEKKMKMDAIIMEAKEIMKHQLKEMGDEVFGAMEIEECPCPRNCGAVRLKAEYIAISISNEGISIKEGELIEIVTLED